MASNAEGQYKGGHFSISHFTGREDFIDALVQVLTDHYRLAQVVGPPGFGKTSTVIQVGHELVSKGKDVLYLTARDYKNVDDIASKVIYLLLNRRDSANVSEPVNELINHLKGIEKETVLIIDHVDKVERDQLQDFVEKIVQNAQNVRVLTTSRQEILFNFSIAEVTHPLSSLCEDKSVELLRKLSKDIEEKHAKELSKLCGGIPLLLCIFGSLLEAMSPEVLIDDLRVKETAIFDRCNLKELPEDSRILELFDVWFCHLSDDLKGSIVSLSVFPMWFSQQLACVVLEKDSTTVSSHLFELKFSSYLTYDKPRKSYFIHSIIKTFCHLKAREDESLAEKRMAAKMAFIRHYVCEISRLTRMFLGKQAKTAMECFIQEELNIKNVLHLCAQDNSVPRQVRDDCTDTANEATEFLAKMLSRLEFMKIFEQLQKCYPEDNPRHAECVTSIGLKIVYSHMPCDLEDSQPYLERAFRLMQTCGPAAQTNCQAQCRGKLARCYAKQGDREKAEEHLQEAIRIREAAAGVMLGVTYNDSAVCMGFLGRIDEAKKIRETEILPIYRVALGDHPFTATALNYLGKDYRHLKDYDNSEKCIKEALKIRLDFLGPDHSETAQSFYALGVTLAEKTQSPEGTLSALSALSKAREIQERVLVSRAELLETLRAMQSVLKRSPGMEKQRAEIDNKIRELDGNVPVPDENEEESL